MQNFLTYFENKHTRTHEGKSRSTVSIVVQIISEKDVRSILELLTE